MILFLRHPKSESWNFSWDRRRDNREPKSQRKQAQAINKVQSEGFLRLRSLL